MFPELFQIPVINTSFNVYGVLMVTGFLSAVFLMRRLAVTIGENPDHITNVALYSLISGVVGARIFYVWHHFDLFRGDPWWSVFAVWRGGLEFLGGFLCGIVLVIIYLIRQKLSVKRYMDLLAVGLMLALAFGRLGCFMGRGCCYGKPTDVSWGVQFPYGSDPYRSQIYPDYARNRPEARIDLPAEYFGFAGEDGQSWYAADEAGKYNAYLKPPGLLTERQAREVSEGKYQCLPVHPTQLYSSANALFLCLVFYLFWRKFAKIYPGTTLGLLLILYGLTRFVLESVRDDNPYEHAWWAIHDGWTISQNIGIYLAIVGLILMIVLFSRKPVRLSGPRGLPREPEPSKAPASPYNGTAPPATVNPEPSPETANPPQKPDMPAEPLDR